MAFGFKITSILFLITLHLIQSLIPVSCKSQAPEENEVDDNPMIPPSLRDLLNDEIASHDVPLEIQKNFVYYLSGFDEENRPIWIVEFGKWDVREMVEGGAEKYKAFDSFIRKAVYRFLNSTRIMSTESNAVEEVILLIDAENFSLKQLRSVPTTTFLIEQAKRFLPIFTKLHAAYIVNVNYVGESLLNLVKPIIGREFDKVEVYGNNKSKWIPRILKQIPRDQIPEWYGGVKDFKPYQVYG